MTAIEDRLTGGATAESLFDGVTRRLRASKRVAGIRANAEAIRDDFPGYRERILERAEAARGGMHVLPGTGGEPYFVGGPPAWHASPVGDNEYVWSLNRMRWWPTLMWAWSVTGDREYAAQAIEELRNWVDVCPRPALSPEAFDGVTPWRSLEVGSRMFDTWPALLEHLVDSEFWTPELVATYAASAADHAEVLSHICPRYWPDADHNHYHTEMVGLFAVATLFPELAGAHAWLEQSVSELERCARNQLTADGGQVEGCPGYHNGSIQRFCRTELVARDHGSSFSSDYLDRVRRGVAYSVHASRPDGTIVPWGDSDPNSSHVGAALYGLLAFDDEVPLATALACASDSAFVNAVFDALGDIPDLRALTERLGRLRSDPRRLPAVNRQHELKQVAVRTSWTREALSIFFACQSPVHHGGHAHIDPMGFDFSAFGRPLLVDPGRFTYREGADRVEFKSATAHNTVTVDRCEPFEYLRKFDYGPQRWGDVLDVRSGADCTVVSARQESFDPVIHYRDIAIVDERFLLIVDRFERFSDGQRAQLYFHLNAADAELVEEQRSCAVTFRCDRHAAAADDRSAAPGLSLAVFAGTGVGTLSGSLLAGRISERIDHARESRRMCVDAVLEGRTGRAGQIAELVTVGIPFRAGEKPADPGDASFDCDSTGWSFSANIDGRVRRLSFAAQRIDYKKE